MTLPVTLRGLLLLGLVAALILTFRSDGAEPGSALIVGAGTGGEVDTEALARGLSRGIAPGHVLRLSHARPTLEEGELLEAAAAFTSLTVRAAPTRPLLVSVRPEGMMQGRTSTLPFQMLGTPGESLPGYLTGESGIIDSVRVTLDSLGAGQGFFRVRPARTGWYDWRMEVGEAGEPNEPIEPNGAGGSGVVGGDEVGGGSQGGEGSEGSQGSQISEGSRARQDSRGSATAPVTVGAWVRAAEPLRLLVIGGPPTWESRFLTRALEEAGVSVGLHQDVGRDFAVTSGVDAVPLTADDLASWDAVVLLPGAPLGPQRLGAIEAYVVERGGGVAIAGAGEATGQGGADGVLARLGLATEAAPAQERTGSGLAWALPPEIVPLPEEPLTAAVSTFLGLSDGATVGATVGTISGASAGANSAPTGGTESDAVAAPSSPSGAPVLLLGTNGRGRAAAVGLRETWRWRMEAGRMAEHRDFWRTLGEWLAGGLQEEWRILPERSHAPVGARVLVRVLDLNEAGMENAPPLRMSRPTGPAGVGPVGAEVRPEAEVRPGAGAEVHPEVVGAEVEIDRHGVAHFLATEPGIYTFSLGDGPPTAAVFASAGGEDDPTGWARVAAAAYASAPPRIAGATGSTPLTSGGVVSADSARVLAAALGGGDGSDESRRLLALLLFIALVSLGVAEWTVRRTRGLP